MTSERGVTGPQNTPLLDTSGTPQAPSTNQLPAVSGSPSTASSASPKGGSAVQNLVIYLLEKGCFLISVAIQGAGNVIIASARQLNFLMTTLTLVPAVLVAFPFGLVGAALGGFAQLFGLRSGFERGLNIGTIIGGIIGGGVQGALFLIPRTLTAGLTVAGEGIVSFGQKGKWERISEANFARLVLFTEHCYLTDPIPLAPKALLSPFQRCKRELLKQHRKGEDSDTTDETINQFNQKALVKLTSHEIDELKKYAYYLKQGENNERDQ